MFLESAKGRGVHYIYLKKYVPERRFKYRQTIYSLGRIDKAIEELERWESDLKQAPKHVIEEGLEKEKVNEWVGNLKFKLHKMERCHLANKEEIIV